MKYKTFLSIAVILIIASSCNKLRHIPFDADFRQSFTIPQATVISITDSLAVPITTNIDSMLKQNNTRTDLVQSAKLSAVTLTITSPSGQSFAFLQDIRILVVTGQGDVEIASKHNISSTSSVLNMDVDNVDIKPYILSNVLNLKVVLTSGNTVIPTDLHVSSDFKVHFEADILDAI